MEKGTNTQWETPRSTDPLSAYSYVQAASEAFKAHGLHRFDELCCTPEGLAQLGLPAGDVDPEADFSAAAASSAPPHNAHPATTGSAGTAPTLPGQTQPAVSSNGPYTAAACGTTAARQNSGAQGQPMSRKVSRKVSRKESSFNVLVEGVAVMRRDTWMRENEFWLRDNRYDDQGEHEDSLALRMEATYGDGAYLGTRR